MIKAVRGAIQINKDTRKEIEHGVKTLINTMTKQNRVKEQEIVSIIFSQTKDLVSMNPATALRSFGYASVPLFCTQEPEYTDSLPRTIRVLLTFQANSRHAAVPVYLGGAEILRKDITGR